MELAAVRGGASQLKSSHHGVTSGVDKGASVTTGSGQRPAAKQEVVGVVDELDAAVISEQLAGDGQVLQLRLQPAACAGRERHKPGSTRQYKAGCRRKFKEAWL
jgi:hypothetical protein